MKTILILIIICVLFNKTNIGQDVFKVVGTYTMHEVITSPMVPEYEETYEYDFSIEPSSIDSFDIQFFSSVTVDDTVRGILINDSVFQIETQWFIVDLGYDSTFECISGEGFVNGDSITLNIYYGSIYAPFLCYGKGIKKKGTAIIKQNSPESNTLLYPNPVTDFLYIDKQNSTAFDKDLLVNIYNLNGKLVKQAKIETSNKGLINVSNLNAGAYFVELQRKIETEYLGKFVIK